MTNDEWWAALFDSVQAVRRREGVVDHERWPLVKEELAKRTAAENLREQAKVERQRPSLDDIAWLKDLGIGNGGE